MLDRVQASNGTGYFSQAVSGYAKQNQPSTGQIGESSKVIHEFSSKEWDRLLHEADHAIAKYQEDLQERGKEALDQKKEQTQAYVLGSGARAAAELKRLLEGGNAQEQQAPQAGSESKAVFRELGTWEIQTAADHTVSDEAIQKILGMDKQAPYSLMADENGVVDYNGVKFQCDYENNRICLGDVSNPKNCISVSLEEGGCLVFNRENIGDLSKAIGMFSPEDVNRIMRAIAQDAKLKQIQMQIEDDASGIEVLERPKEEGAEHA